MRIAKLYNVVFKYKVIDSKFNIGYVAELHYRHIGKREVDALGAAYDTRSDELLNEIKDIEVEKGRTYVEGSLHSMEITSIPNWRSPFPEKTLIRDKEQVELPKEEYEVKLHYKVKQNNDSTEGEDAVLVVRGNRAMLENITSEYSHQSEELSKAVQYYEAMKNRKYVEDSIHFMEIIRLNGEMLEE